MKEGNININESAIQNESKNEEKNHQDFKDLNYNPKLEDYFHEAINAFEGYKETFGNVLQLLAFSNHQKNINYQSSVQMLQKKMKLEEINYQSKDILTNKKRSNEIFFLLLKQYYSLFGAKTLRMEQDKRRIIMTLDDDSFFIIHYSDKGITDFLLVNDLDENTDNDPEFSIIKKQAIETQQFEPIIDYILRRPLLF